MASQFRSSLYRVGSVLLHPRQAFEVMVHEDVSIGLPLLLAAAIFFAEGALTVSAILRAIPLPLGFLIALAGPFTGLGFAVAGVLWLGITALLIHANAVLLGGEGDITRMFSVAAYSILPVSIPLGAFALAVLVGGFGALGWLALGGMLWFVALLWGLALLIIGTSVNYNIDAGRALLAAVLIPLADLLLVLFLGKYGLILILAAYGLAYYFTKVQGPKLREESVVVEEGEKHEG